MNGHIARAPDYAGGWLSRLWNMLWHPLEWHRDREEELWQQVRDQRLAWRVQDTMYGLGLVQHDSSIGGGRTVRHPELVSVSAERGELVIRLLPGQTPRKFEDERNREAFAYYLGVTEIKVKRLRTPLIQLRLGDPCDWVPPASAGAAVSTRR